MFLLKNVVKKYEKRVVLKIDELTIKSKNITAISGPNGSGKSTLLELLSGIKKPTEGEIFFEKKDIRQKNLSDIVMILQNPVMFNSSVYSNVAFGLKVKNTEKKIITEKVNDVLDIINLKQFSKQNARTLSGGEMQRVAIARALVLEPKVILMDEPTSGLDLQAKELLKQTIKKIHMEKKIDFIIASHDTDFLLQIATRAFSLLNGKLAPDSIANLFTGHIKDGQIHLENGVKFILSTLKKGRVNIMIYPENIVLSKEPLKSSMTNVFEAEITKLIKSQSGVKVWVDIGIELCCMITSISLKKMGITIGDKIFVEFKATSIKVY